MKYKLNFYCPNPPPPSVAAVLCECLRLSRLLNMQSGKSLLGSFQWVSFEMLIPYKNVPIFHGMEQK